MSDISQNSGKRAIEEDSEDEEEVYIPLKQRRQQGLVSKESVVVEDNVSSGQVVNSNRSSLQPSFEFGDSGEKTLLQVRREMLAMYGEKTEEEKRKEQEEYVQSHLNAEQKPLVSRRQAAGQEEAFDEGILTGWRAPKQYRDKPKEFFALQRKKHNVFAKCDEEDQIAPLIQTFLSMRIPLALLEWLKQQGIHTPTTIQMQGLPCVLSGSDVVGIAGTGNGKTLVFALPMVLLALREELHTPMRKGEGPFGVVLVPFRELASQIYDIVESMTLFMLKANFPAIHSILAIGGSKVGDQFRKIPNNSGVHCVIATPGSLAGLLKTRKINFQRTKFLAIDEADRLVEPTFEDDQLTIFDGFTARRQTVMFSATMPKRVQDFILKAQICPVLISSSIAGRANKDIIQEVEYVRSSVRMPYLLSVLEKTSPPVLVFANSKDTVDLLHEFLLSKGVSVCSIHGGKLQDERLQAVSDFREGKRDVLVATDVASKGLDFEGVQHVINYDVPDEIEDYIHRIGRTGRKGNVGVATSFISRETRPSFLLDQKSLLKDAEQDISAYLLALEDPREYVKEGDEDVSCEYCGGMGHRLLDCPKLQRLNSTKVKNTSYEFAETEY